MKGWIVALVICAVTAAIIAGLWQVRNQHFGLKAPVCISIIVSCP